MSFFSFAKKQNLTQIIEIRDTYVSSSVVLLSSEDKPKIIFCENIKFANIDTTDFEKYTKEMLNSLSDSVHSAKVKLTKIGNRQKISTYKIFLSPLWCISRSRTIKYKKETPFLIDNKFIDRLFDENDEAKGSELSILEKKIVESKISGYKVENLIGKRATDIEIEIFTSYVSQSLKKSISKIFEKLQKKNDFELSSYSLSSYSFLRDLYSDKNDFIYMDIGDLISEVSLVRNDTLFGTISVPIGKKAILENIATKLNLPQNLAVSAMNMHAQGSQNSPENKEVLSAEISSFLVAMDTAIVKMCNPIDLPKHIFLLRNDDFAVFLVREIERIKNTNTLSAFNPNMIVNPIDDGIINAFIIGGKFFKNYPFVKIDALFANKLLRV